MAAVSGAVTKYDTKGQRERLQDAIYSISPEETPLVSSIERTSTDAVLTEWQTDALADAVTTNAQVEGDEFTFTTPAMTVRVGNYSQIMSKTASVTRTTRRIRHAGRADEMDYQVMKRGKELRRDLEKTIFHNIGGVAGDATTARQMATLGAWVKTNVDKHSGGDNPTYTSGVPSAGRTDSGTLRAFSETIGKNCMSLAWAAGGNPTTLMVGPFNKQAASGFAGIADRVFNLNAPRPTVSVGAIDVWVTDFGTLRIVSTRHQRERDAWFLDFSLLEIPVLDPLQAFPLAKRHDSDERGMVQELTFKVKQEAGLALAADLTTA